MILPVLPCLLHASWRLMEETDHIDRLPSSRFNAAKRPYLRDRFILLYISCQSPMRNSMFYWIKENQVLFLLSSKHPATHSSQETRVSEGQHKCLQPCSVWNTKTLKILLKIQDYFLFHALWEHYNILPTSKLKVG